MKNKFKWIVLLAPLLLTSCNGQNKEALKKVQEIEAVVNEKKPESVTTSATGWTLTAKINGKSWKAASMDPPQMVDRIIGNYEEESIGLPFTKSNMVGGNTIEFGEFKAADLTLDDDVVFWVGREGQMQITKQESDWVEGIFNFIATSSSTHETMMVTDGFFRIKIQ